MKRRENDNGKYVSVPKELYERLLESKVGTTASMIKNSIIDHTVRYVIIGLIIFGSVSGSYWYISTKTSEAITSVKIEIAEAVDIHPIESTKKWFGNGKHWWSESNETNKTSTMDKIKGFFKSDNNISVESDEENISQENNKTSFFTKAKSWISWGKDKNTTKE